MTVWKIMALVYVGYLLRGIDLLILNASIEILGFAALIILIIDYIKKRIIKK